MNKADRIATFDSGSTHAMTLTAVDLDANGKPVKWKVEVQQTERCLARTRRTDNEKEVARLLGSFHKRIESAILAPQDVYKRQTPSCVPFSMTPQTSGASR